ncbi:uncharacterized protein LOC108346477 [Vigna angularis]|uniref:uncharacterized protein LOC108346477 n=1 Tax=Phaseolus angularis TaxID=3914 RepID=UPI0008099E63|nr:uncharacterized protein LOC108346477 [Vigna angularis]
MSFGLKNAGATYQRLMDKVFKQQIGRCMEVYVDDMVVRTRTVEEHAKDLAEVFGQVRGYGMRLNPAKCSFGVAAGKFLGFMLTKRGIEANPEKCQAVLEMRSPQNLKEAERIRPIVKIMKKDVKGLWNDQCEGAFAEVKQILTSPPVMGRPESGHDLQLYLATTDVTISVALNSQRFRDKVLAAGEGSAGSIERSAALEALLLDPPGGEFGLRYEPLGSVRGQHLAEFATELPIDDGDNPFLWKLFVDGSTSKSRGGAGIVLEGPDGVIIEQSFIFRFKISNNQAEYEALIAGMELGLDLGVISLECWTDLQLVEGHINGSFQVKDDQLLQYFHRAQRLRERFKTIEVKHIPREENTGADVLLSKLACGNEKGQLSLVIRRTLMKPIIECSATFQPTEQFDWRKEIIELIKGQEEGRPMKAKDAKRIALYFLIRKELYRRGFAALLMKCLMPEEAEYVLRELHEGVCRRHTGQRALQARVLRVGYF